MRLRCYASIYEHRYKITKEIDEIFEKANIKLCGYHDCSFLGHVYSITIESITKISLYKTRNTKELILINNKLINFIDINNLKNFKNPQKNDIELIQNIDIRTYYPETFCKYNFYNFTYEDLINLHKFFQICIDNDLFLQADIE